MEKMGTLKKNGDQKTNFGPHGDQSPQMGTKVPKWGLKSPNGDQLGSSGSKAAPVWNKSQGVGPDPVEELDEGKGEIKKKKAEKIPRVGIGQDEANPVALQ